jgi:O-methyltransferase
MDISIKRSIASTLFPKYIPFLDKFNRTPLFVEFVKKNRHVKAYETREEMYDEIMRQCPEPIDYLEFGVFEGRSLLYWAEKRKEHESRFFGFDTFTGLPENWNKYFKKGDFNLNGAAPNISDSRVSLIKGMFQDSLPTFLKNFRQNNNRLIIHNDSDLYSSSLYLLTVLNNFLVAGTMVMFDEFGDVQHEFRAFFDYLSAYGRNYRVVGAALKYYTITVEML